MQRNLATRQGGSAGNGPGAVPELSPSTGTQLDPASRAIFEPRFGQDLSSVRIHTDDKAGQIAASLGVRAFARGNQIGFARGASPSGAGADRVLAHELAHVVQQQRGETRNLTAGPASSERRRLEHEAETSAKAILAGAHLPRREAAGPPAPVMQGFDPDYHETAVIGGAAGVFTPEETGKIYEANWRRDFSQAAPGFADIVIAWKQLKDAAPADRPPLQQKLANAVVNVGNPTGETYGGYQTWEHMDNPGGAEAAKQDAAWNGPFAGKDIAGYIKESRAYIKENLADAVFHPGLYSQLDPENQRALDDARSTGRVSSPRPAGSPDPYGERAARPQPAGKGYPPDPRESSSVVASDVTAIARNATGATSTPTSGFTDDPATADHLGRASHALEDFFAHSNFVELSERQRSGQRIRPDELKTGTFGWGDKAHALADKIRAITTDIRAHMDLIGGVLKELQLKKLDEIATELDAVAGAVTGPESHTALNKDEPTRPYFAMAHKLATAADRLVFQSIHHAMQASAPEERRKLVYDTYALVDALVNIPSDAHPLKATYTTP